MPVAWGVVAALAYLVLLPPRRHLLSAAAVAVVVGALTMDTIFRLDTLPDGPGKFIPTDAVEVAEGMASAQAAAIVRLGGEAALWASAGTDPSSELGTRVGTGHATLDPRSARG